MKKYQHTLLFILLLIVVALFYNYPSYFNEIPTGNHNWRQTDCASLALNYYQNDMNPLKPRIHYVLSGQGYGVGEFPILYYATAVLYKVFGVHEGIFRTLNLLIFCCGLLALFFTIRDYTKNYFMAYLLPILVWTSPVLGFYTFNFLSDGPALGLSLIGLYHFFRYYESGKQSALNWSMFFFLFGGLLKITALIPFVAISGLHFFELVGLLKFKKENTRLFNKKWQHILPFILVVVGIGIWYYTAIQYNQTHDNTYFSTRTWPVWDMPRWQINLFFFRLFKFWMPFYFNPIIHLIFIGCIGFIFVKRKAFRTFEWGFVGIGLLGVFLFLVLWAYAFIDHEYYVINLMHTPIFATIFVTRWLTDNKPKIVNHWAFLGALLLLLSFTAYQTKQKIKLQYKPNNRTINDAFYDPGFKDFLKENDIKYPDLAFSVPDNSPNITLYHMNLRGWTNLLTPRVDMEIIELMASWDAKYLIVSDTTYLSKPEMQPFLEHEIANFQEQIYFFDITVFKK
jgi:hypothetical protein